MDRRKPGTSSATAAVVRTAAISMTTIVLRTENTSAYGKGGGGGEAPRVMGKANS